MAEGEIDEGSLRSQRAEAFGAMSGLGAPRQFRILNLEFEKRKLVGGVAGEVEVGEADAVDDDLVGADCGGGLRLCGSPA